MIQSGCLLTKFRFGFVKKSMEICLFCSVVSGDPSHFNIDQQTTIFFCNEECSIIHYFSENLFPWVWWGAGDMIQIDGF